VPVSPSIGRRDPGHEREQLAKGRAAADQSLRLRLVVGVLDRLHALDIAREGAGRIEERRELDVDVMLAARAVVQVQHALALARQARARQRAGLAGLVARLAVAVRDLVAGAADEFGVSAMQLAVGGVGGDDAVLRIAQDMRLGQAVEKTGEIGWRWLHRRPWKVMALPFCPNPDSSWQTEGAADLHQQPCASRILLASY
jgi:hypothetical protein